MKIILSRKGFDSSSGGHPSPIFSDGSMVSLPIPEPGGRVQYSSCAWRGETYYDLMRRLGIRRLKTSGRSVRLTRTTGAHVDPDLSAETRSRQPGWRPLFGQTAGRQTHLKDHGVARGDVFLFYGWFRNNDDDIHAIWGWLKIADIFDVDTDELPRWANDHPHVLGRGTGVFAKGNTLYAGSSGGVFRRFSKSLQLTKAGETRSVWELPMCFHPSETTMTGQRADGWSTSGNKAILRSAPRGQEFVVETNLEMRRWLDALIVPTDRRR